MNASPKTSSLQSIWKDVPGGIEGLTAREAQDSSPHLGPGPAQRRSATIKALAPTIQHEMRVWAKHVEDFGYSRTDGDKMPRADAWRPYRFAVQDVILALTAMRHAKDKNAIEVDVFLASDPAYRDEDDIPQGQELYPFEPFASHSALCLMLLSEAFRCGTPMTLAFTPNVERSEEERRQGAKTGRVPDAIIHLAEIHGTPVPDRESGRIESREAVPLYAALSGFYPEMRQRLDDLSSRGLLSIERACYLVQHGVWSVPELDGLIQGCPYPDLVLNGEIPPENRHLYNHAQFQARSALLGGVLDRALLIRQPVAAHEGGARLAPKGRAVGADVTSPHAPGKDVEDDDRNLAIRFDPDLSARVYALDEAEAEPLPLPDWRPFTDRSGEPTWAAGIPQGRQFVALLRPRDASGLRRSLSSDIERAALAADGGPIAVVVPFDFNDLFPQAQADFLAEAERAGVWLLVCPETASALDGFAQEKLSRSRVLPQ